MVLRYCVNPCQPWLVTTLLFFRHLLWELHQQQGNESADSWDWTVCGSGQTDLQCIIKTWSLTIPMCSDGATAVAGVLTNHQSGAATHGWCGNHRRYTDNPLDENMSNYLKTPVSDGGTNLIWWGLLIVPVKHSVDTVTCHFAGIHLMKIQHTHTKSAHNPRQMQPNHSLSQQSTL